MVFLTEVASWQAKTHRLVFDGSNVCKAAYPMMTKLQNLTVEQLRRVISLKEQIEGLEAELAGLVGDGAPRRGRPPGAGKGRKMSAAGRAAIRAAVKARWAKYRGETGETAPKKRRKMSAAGRAAIAAAAKARWAKVKAAGKKGL